MKYLKNSLNLLFVLFCVACAESYETAPETLVPLVNGPRTTTGPECPAELGNWHNDVIANNTVVTYTAPFVSGATYTWDVSDASAIQILSTNHRSVTIKVLNSQIPVVLDVFIKEGDSAGCVVNGLINPGLECPLPEFDLIVGPDPVFPGQMATVSGDPYTSIPNVVSYNWWIMGNNGYFNIEPRGGTKAWIDVLQGAPDDSYMVVLTVTHANCGSKSYFGTLYVGPGNGTVSGTGSGRGFQ